MNACLQGPRRLKRCGNSLERNAATGFAQRARIMFGPTPISAELPDQRDLGQSEHRAQSVSLYSLLRLTHLVYAHSSPIDHI